MGQRLDLPDKDVWGLVMPKDSPLAGKTVVTRTDLEGLPLIFSRQALSPYKTGNELEDWFGGSLDTLDIVTTFNLVYNAAIMVEAGIGYAVTIDGITDTSPSSNLCFRPMEPRLESGLSLIWKKHQVFPPAAKEFINRLMAMVQASH